MAYFNRGFTAIDEGSASIGLNSGHLVIEDVEDDK